MALTSFLLIVLAIIVFSASQVDWNVIKLWLKNAAIQKLRMPRSPWEEKLIKFEDKD